MPNQLEIYKCTHCGNIVEVLHGGGAELVCCGEAMKHMKEGATDGALEKHVPVIEKVDDGYKVKVGSAPHPNGSNCWPTAEAIPNFSSPATRRKPSSRLTPPR